MKVKSEQTANVPTITRELMLRVVRNWDSWTGHSRNSLLIIISSLNSEEFFFFRFSLSLEMLFLYFFFIVFHFIHWFSSHVDYFQSFQECSQFHFNKLIIKGVKIIQRSKAKTFPQPLFIHNTSYRQKRIN